MLPLYLPLHADDGTIGGLIGLLSPHRAGLLQRQPGRAAGRPGAPRAASTSPRNELIEGIIAESEDESLMDRYLGGEDIPLETLVDDLETAVARGSFYPVLAALRRRPGSALEDLLEVLTSAFPTPAEHALPPVTGIDGTPARAADLRPGRPAGRPRWSRRPSTRTSGGSRLVRVFSGTLQPGPVRTRGPGTGWPSAGHEDHDADERVGAPLLAAGATLRPVDLARGRRHLSR